MRPVNQIMALVRILFRIKLKRVDIILLSDELFVPREDFLSSVLIVAICMPDSSVWNYRNPI